MSRKQRKAWRRELVQIASRWHQMRGFARAVTLALFNARRHMSSRLNVRCWSGAGGPDPLNGVSIPRVLRKHIRREL